MKAIYKITLILLFIPLISFGNNDKKKQEKSKTINKKYDVNSDAKVSIDNRYGNIDVTTWNQNRVEIEVKIIVKGNDLEAVEDKLKNIDVDFNASSSYVSAKTTFVNKGGGWSWWKKSKNLSFQINYTVKMPKTNAADLENDYGNIYLDELSGSADINCNYGKISVGELLAENNRINLDYCSRSTIGFIKSGDVHVDYSKLTLEKAEKIRLNTGYSSVTCNEVDKLNFNIDYGSLTVDDASKVSGKSDYASMRFGKIHKNLRIETDYGAVKVAELMKGFETVDISGEYAGIRIGIESGNTFDFVLNLKYAGFKRNSEDIELFKSISKSSKKYYEGTYGKGKSSSKVIIRSQYGGVSFKESY